MTRLDDAIEHGYWPHLVAGGNADTYHSGMSRILQIYNLRLPTLRLGTPTLIDGMARVFDFAAVRGPRIDWSADPNKSDAEARRDDWRAVNGDLATALRAAR